MFQTELLFQFLFLILNNLVKRLIIDSLQLNVLINSDKEPTSAFKGFANITVRGTPIRTTQNIVILIIAIAKLDSMSGTCEF